MDITNDEIKHCIFTYIPIKGAYRPERAICKPTQPNSNTVICKLDENGYCNIFVVLHSSKNESRILKALIDTGAYYNHIKQIDINEPFELTGNFAEYHTDKPEKSEMYKGSLEIPHMHTTVPFEFCVNPKLPIFNFGYDMLLGATFLNSFILKYNYPKPGEFTLDSI